MATVVAAQTRIASSPTHQAYQILRVGFAALPIIAGLDKFFYILVNWDMYLAPFVVRLSPISGHTLMMIIGVIEIAAGILVAVRPRVGAYLYCYGLALGLSSICSSYRAIMMWLCAISDSLWGALALGRIAMDFD